MSLLKITCWWGKRDSDPESGINIEKVWCLYQSITFRNIQVYQEDTRGMAIVIILKQVRDENVLNTICHFLWVYFLELGLGIETTLFP